MTCAQCKGIEIIFDKKNADKEYNSYLKKGANKTTKHLLTALNRINTPFESLIDIGGGIGAIQLEFAKLGVKNITNVDGSEGYIEYAKKLAKEMNTNQEIEYLHGDITDLGDSLRQADIVTLDKVFCCYNNIEKLVEVSSSLAIKFYAVVFPRDTWLAKIFVQIVNIGLKISKNPFRTFIHSTKDIDTQLKDRGWNKIILENKFFWQIAIFEKN